MHLPKPVLKAAESDLKFVKPAQIVAKSKQIAGKPEQIPAKQKKIAAIANQISAKPEQIPAISEQIAAISDQIAAKSKQIAAKLKQTPAKPVQITAKPKGIADKPKEIAAKPEQNATKPQQMTAKEGSVATKQGPPSGKPPLAGECELDPLSSRILEAELQRIMMKVWRELPDDAPSDAEKLVVDTFRNEAEDDFKNILGLNVTKRLLNVHNGLYVKVTFSKKPEGHHLKEFLRRYRCTGLKRVEGGAATFAVQVRSFEDFDRLCNAKNERCGNVSIGLAPYYTFTQCPSNLKTIYSEINNENQVLNEQTIESDGKKRTETNEPEKKTSNNPVGDRTPGESVTQAKTEPKQTAENQKEGKVVSTLVTPKIEKVAAKPVTPKIETVVAKSVTPKIETVVAKSVTPKIETVVAKSVTPKIETVVAKPVTPKIETVVAKSVTPKIETVVAKSVTPKIETVVAKSVTPKIETVVAKPVTPKIETVVAKSVTPKIETVVAKSVTPKIETVVAKPVTPKIETVVAKPVTPKIETVVGKPVTPKIKTVVAKSPAMIAKTDENKADTPRPEPKIDTKTGGDAKTVCEVSNVTTPKTVNKIQTVKKPVKLAEEKIAPKGAPANNVKINKKVSSANINDNDELEDEDILALIEEGIVLDECSGSDEE